MLLRTLLISFSLLVSSCGGLPAKPKVIICVIDYPSSEGICGETDGEDIKKAKDIAYKRILERLKSQREVTRIPLSTMDKNVCFAPKEWEKVQNYVDELVEFAKSGCQ